MRLTREHRLRKSAEFRRLTARGARVRSAPLTLVHADSPSGLSRLGLAVSRKVGNAVERNLLKRRLREIVRHRLAGDEGSDLLLIARPGAAELRFCALEAEVDRLLRRMRQPPRHSGARRRGGARSSATGVTSGARAERDP